MAKGGILGNPAVIGAVTASITWFLLDEVFDDAIEKLLGKKGKKGGRGGGGGKKVKMIKNKFGEVYPVVDDDFDSYYGAYQRAWY